jgi:hypothetical protein
MMAEIAPEKWYPPTAKLLGLSGVGLLLRVVGGNSPTVSGGMVFLAGCLGLALVVMWGRASRPERRHAVVYAMVPIMLVAVVAGIDIAYIRENGVVINATGLVALFVGGFVARGRV